MSNKIYAIIGPHASGKTTLVQRIMELGIHYIPGITTRPAKKISTRPDTFRVVDKADFFQYDCIVKTTYKGNYYGLLKKDVLDSLQTYPISVVIVDPVGLKQLSRLIKGSFASVYLMCDYVVLVERMLRLGHSNDEIKHHLEYAENNNEFDSWKIATHVIKNTRDEESALMQLLAIMGVTTLRPAEELDAMTAPIEGSYGRAVRTSA
ncbi:MAG: guanylate kinase [Schwartzia sp. (in: firmicutes)]